MSDPKVEYIPAGPETIREIASLMHKAIDDVFRVMTPTVDKVGEVAGPAGIFAVVQRLIGQLTVSSAIAFTSMRLGDPDKVAKELAPDGMTGRIKTNMDDLLFVCLAAYCAEDGEARPDIMNRAHELFQHMRGYKHNIPAEWWAAQTQTARKKEVRKDLQ